MPDRLPADAGTHRLGVGDHNASIVYACRKRQTESSLSRSEGYRPDGDQTLQPMLSWMKDSMFFEFGVVEC